jgi:hypothetical protein
MLASIIDRLTSLVSKYLVLGFFVPVLIFSFITGAILYQDVSWFREWAKPEISGTAKAFDTGAALIALAIAAYLFSTVNTFLREVLEGKHFLEHSPLFQRLFQARQQAKLQKLETDYLKARKERAVIVSQKQTWINLLSTAANTGIAKHKGDATFNPAASNANKLILELEELQSLAKPIESAQIKGAVDALKIELEQHDESVPDSSGTLALRGRRADVLVMLDYAEDSWRSVELRNFNERQSRFGLSHVAPTAMGNVALSMQSYAITRYQMNLEKFWGDLQAILQASKDFYTQLQDAKTQLDFLVTCCWLSIFVTLGCVPVLLARGQSAVLFMAVALGGPASAYFFYFLGTKNYQSFAEFVRIGLDLYRFELLDALHVARPKTVRDERAIWSTLQRLSYMGSEGTELSYTSDAKTQAQ